MIPTSTRPMMPRLRDHPIPFALERSARDHVRRANGFLRTLLRCVTLNPMKRRTPILEVNAHVEVPEPSRFQQPEA
jgi:hypothetical protein